MERHKKRLGKGLEDISHSFLSSEQASDSKSSVSKDIYETEITGNQPRVIGVTSRTPDIPAIFWTGHLALTLARYGKKVLLIDIGTDNEELASVLKPLSIYPSLNDLLNQSGKAITVEGPLDLRVLAFQLQLGEFRQFKQEERDVLFQILRWEEEQSDVILINIHFNWMEADLLSCLRCLDEMVLLASSQELLNAYRLLKVLFHTQPGIRVGLVEYGGGGSSSQANIQQLVVASNKFLGKSPLILGRIPSDSSVIRSMMAGSHPCLPSQKGSGIQELVVIGQRILQGLNSREGCRLFFEQIQAQLNTGP